MHLFVIFTAVSAVIAVPLPPKALGGYIFPEERRPSDPDDSRRDGVQYPDARTWEDVSLFYGELRDIRWPEDKSQIIKPQTPEVPATPNPNTPNSNTPNSNTPNSENSNPFQDFDPAQITSDVLNGAYKYTLWPTLGAGAAALLNLLGGGGGGVGVPSMPSIPDVGAYSGN
ncbi:hypothetical protein MMC22_000542 [Lobaria immixta]|nr:hypothetical protein [Lobaria immixta]